MRILEDKIVNGEMSPDEVTAAETMKAEEEVNSTTPEKPRKVPRVSEDSCPSTLAHKRHQDKEEDLLPSTPTNILQRINVYGEHCATTLTNTSNPKPRKREATSKCLVLLVHNTVLCKCLGISYSKGFSMPGPASLCFFLP